MTVRSPLTGADDAVQISSIPTEQLIDDWEARFQIDISGEFKGFNRIAVLQCQRTGLVFFAPQEAAGSEYIYRELQKIDWYYTRDKWEHKTALKHLRKGTSILEVGCGTGEFLKMAGEAGLTIKGIEMSTAAVQEAQARGLPAELADLQQTARHHPEGFDVVCSFQVLEHVSDPGDFLRQSLDVLKPGGRLIVGVPNSGGYLKYQYELLNLPPHHMSQWQPSTFKAMEAFIGMTLVRCLIEPLAKRHTALYLQSYGDRVRSYRGGKLLYNSYTCRLYDKALQSGLCRFLPGHTLYAEFIKKGVLG